MADLPHVSSTTSLSDNVQLRQYYDKLLFKNSSGKSLSDLPAKAREQTKSNLNPEYQESSKDTSEYNEEQEDRHQGGNGHANGSGNLDFISGFRNVMYQTDASPLPSSDSHRMAMSFSESVAPPVQMSSMFQFNESDSQPFGMVPMTTAGSSVGRNSISGPGASTVFSSEFSGVPPQIQQMGFMNVSSGMNSRPGSLPGSATGQPGSNMAPTVQMLPSHSRTNSIVSATSASPSSFYDAMNQAVSPTGQLSPVNSAIGSIGAGTVSPTNVPFRQESYAPSQAAYSSARRSSYISDNLIHGHNSNMNNGNGMNTGQPKYMTQQRQSQPAQGSRSAMHAKQPSVAGSGNGITPGNTSFISGVQAPLGQGVVLGQNTDTISGVGAVPIPGNLPQNGTFSLENGLLLKDGQIMSSQSLSQLYKECGENFFASQPCYEFVDNLKALIKGESSEKDRSEKIQRFLGFLKSCNLNYNPQSDAFVSTSKHRRSSTSSYLHYKPLVLVALKNGKLELLSLPQGTNLDMVRDDLIIIDGDRGKDLACCIEPIVDLDLALVINFLKKKIHFDSLITSRSQHYPVDQFIDALMSNANGSQDDLNPKLYDVIELTQLIIPSKQILRFATPWECSSNLHSKFQDELKALHIAQLKLKALNSSNSMKAKSTLNIKILNSEFQFDRKKLTFYYICQERNDFRELIKELFKFYKTRIWLCAIPNNLGIDAKYYDNERKEWAMYEDMMKHFKHDELIDNNLPPQTGFIVAPALNRIRLDNFQIGVYRELVNALF